MSFTPIPLLVYLLRTHSTITLTRKLFTMLLSVIVYNHKLTPGQWVGAGVVFAGISVEAFVKRKGQNMLRSKATQANARKQMYTPNG